MRGPSRTAKDSGKIATLGVARRLKQDASTIHAPDNVQSLEDDFWRRMDAVVTETLEHESRRPTLDQHFVNVKNIVNHACCWQASPH